MSVSTVNANWHELRLKRKRLRTANVRSPKSNTPVKRCLEVLSATHHGNAQNPKKKWHRDPTIGRFTLRNHNLFTASRRDKQMNLQRWKFICAEIFASAEHMASLKASNNWVAFRKFWPDWGFKMFRWKFRQIKLHLMKSPQNPRSSVNKPAFHDVAKRHCWSLNIKNVWTPYGHDWKHPPQSAWKHPFAPGTSDEISISPAQKCTFLD